MNSFVTPLTVIAMLTSISVSHHGAPSEVSRGSTSHVDKLRAEEHPGPDGWIAEDRAAAVDLSRGEPTLVDEVLAEDLLLRQQRLRQLGLGMKDIEHSYLWLQSPLVNTFEDSYGPVGFMHSRHAAQLGGDCATCHHYRPANPTASETVACRACHREAFDPDRRGKIGLKAAYHMQCMGCHEEMEQGPVACDGCHSKNVPHHESLVKLPPDPTPMDVTRECLRCHENAGSELLESAHWLWRGPSRFTVEHRNSVGCGKCAMVLNNYCLSVISNEARCTSCHVGYGWKDASFDFADRTRVDCLVCHDTTDSYQKSPTAAGMPEPEVDLAWVAANVGRTSRQSCGDCHFSGGGGDAVKHGDMSAALNWPTRDCDVHMGGYGFQCSDCHETRNHRISGRSTSVCVAEGSLACERCHTARPHYGDTLVDHHLNEHCATIACNTCHSPVYAKCAPTKVWWDWSTAGDTGRQVAMDRYGKPDYDWMKGSFRWRESARPFYAWFNGYTKRLLLGDVIDPAARGFTPGESPGDREKTMLEAIHITEPVGSYADPTAKITPFKVMEGIQPADAVYRYLLVPHLYPYDEDDEAAYWNGLDWQAAFAEGMKRAGLPYSGRYIWVRSVMYWRIEHEVMPKESALSCANCHETLSGARTCERCHEDARGLDFKALSNAGIDFADLARQGRDVQGLVGKTDYIEFEKLGYRGDPILYGGRFMKLQMRYRSN